MANQPYLVVRLVPEAPIDGATFTTYLDGLQLQVFDAYLGTPLSDLVYSSPLAARLQRLVGQILRLRIDGHHSRNRL